MSVENPFTISILTTKIVLKIVKLLIFRNSSRLDTMSIKMGQICYLFLLPIGSLTCLGHGCFGHADNLLLKLLLVQLMPYVTFFAMLEEK